MKALCWHGTGDVRVDTVPDPRIEHPRDAIVRITASGICGSDLHLYDGFMPTMEEGDILGHEPMGEVVEVGSAIQNLKPGDRVVVPFTIACGSCFFCKKTLHSCCDTSNPNAEVARKAMGHSPAGRFGFSHKRYFRRDSEGQFKESDDAGRSSARIGSARPNSGRGRSGRPR